jgi:hypothetical protein
MELEGNLATFQFGDVLKFLSMGRMTGTLILENEKRSIVLLIRDGALKGSASADRDVKLGQLLVQQGRLGRKQLSETLEQQRERRGMLRLGKLLVDRKLVSRETLQSTVALQVKEELWEAFSWTSGSFRFEHGPFQDPDDDLLSMPIEPLIEEGAERLEQWRAIAANLGHMDDVYRACVRIAGPPEAALTPAAWRVLSLINGRIALKGLIALSGLGKFETLSSLDRLLTLGLIESTGRRSDPSEKRANGRRSSPAAATDSQANETPAESDGAGGGLRSLFGLRRRASGGKNQTDPGSPAVAALAEVVSAAATAAAPHATDVAFACAILNRLADRYEEALGRNDPRSSLEAAWDAETVRRPRADLVRLAGGRLDPARYEAYVKRAGGIDRFLAGCHEETMEALTAAGRTYVKQAQEAIAAEAVALAKQAAAPLLNEKSIQWPADFSPRLWLQQWTEE